MASVSTTVVTKTADVVFGGGEAVVASEPTVVVSTAPTYGRVVLSLDNCLLPAERLDCTPSSQDGLDRDSELELRILGCEKIQSAGILLKLPQVAMATGQVLFHRFFYSKSLIRYNYEVVAMGCVCLASKIEEAPRRVRDVVNVFHHIKQLKNSKQIQPMILDQNYLNLKNQVIKAERRVLKELGFCVHVKHPHKVIVMYLQVLECKSNQRLTQLSWNYMNDSLRTDVFLRYSPETIACACIYLSARKLQIPLPNRPPWYGIFRVSETDVRDICQIILKLYARPKSNVEKLEKMVEDLKKAQDAAKLKAKGLSSSNTPQGSGRFSPNSRSNSPRKNDNSSPSDAKKDRDGVKEDSKGKRNADSPRISNKESNHHASKNDDSRSPSSRDRKSERSSRSRSPSRTPIKRKRRANAAASSTSASSPTSRSHGGGDRDHKNRSRSKSTDRGGGGGGGGGGSKKHRSKRSRRSRSAHTSPPVSSSHDRSPQLPPPPSSSSHRNHKKSHHKDKLKYRSSHSTRDGSSRTYRSRSRSYDKYSSSGAKSGSRKDRSRDNGHHRSRSHERSRR